MGINDYGGTGDALNSPPLGGPGGWAEAVAAVVDGDDTTVDARIATAVAGIDLDPYLLPAEVLAGANVTVDRDTTPGSVIIASTGGSGGVGGTSGIYRVVLGVGGTDSDWTYLGSPVTGRPADMPAWGIIQFDTAQHEDVTEPTQFMWDHGEAGDQWMRWQTVLFPTP